MLRTLAAFAERHKWLVLLTWLLLVGGVNVAGQTYGGTFSNDLSVKGTDAQAAYDTMVEKFPAMSGDGMQVVIHDPAGVESGTIRPKVEAALAAVAGQKGVTSVQSPYGPEQRMISADGTTALATVRFAERAADIDEEQIEAAQDAFAPVDQATAQAQVEFGGAALSKESGPSGSEVIGLGAAVLVLLLAFGSVFAMLVPLLTAVLALGLGLGIIRLISEYVTIGTAGPVVAAMIGLGVGIDYALLVVTRHREGLATGLKAKESIPTALATAGRSVLVAGVTVIIAILSLYAIGIPFVATLGLASAITVATTLLAAVTLLPALLGVFGDRLDRLRVRRARLDHGEGRTGGWHRWTHHVQRHPGPYAVLATVVLAVIAVPLFSLRLGSADDGSAPKGSTERAAYELVKSSFGAGWTGPLLVTAEYDGGTEKQTRRAAGELRTQIAAVEGVTRVGPPMINEAGDTAVLTVVPNASPDDEKTEELVHRLRNGVLSDQPDGTAVHVGGATATSIDLADRLGERMPWFMAFVVGLSLLLLLVEFRSIFVPIKAALMNLLSVGAAYGAVVAVFQWGWLADLLGAEPGPIESFAPMMLFAVLFGLSMDYEVFLLSRVREEYVRTGQARAAVADGIAATARVITAAASVMVVVFSSFQLNDQRVVNLFGFGLAVAIAIDATIVRMMLVPALMAIAGRFAWYMPKWLDRVLPKIELEPSPIDPFEAQLDQVGGTDRPDAPSRSSGPDEVARLGGGNGSGPATRAVSTIATTAMVATNGDAGDGGDGGSGTTPDPYAALALLRTVVEERDAYREKYEEGRAELADLRRRHDVLVEALNVLRVAGEDSADPVEGVHAGQVSGRIRD